MTSVKNKTARKSLRYGYTTGACAAAAAGAALEHLLTGSFPTQASVKLPGGEKVILPVFNCGHSNDESFVEIKKDAGDDPDITHGAIVGCKVRLTGNTDEIKILRGEGIGIVTRPGLAVPVGEPAINPVPKKMIINEITNRLPANFHRGVEVTPYIIAGEKLAKRTLNPRLGIVGGLSILGTTGIVKPFSAEAYKETIDICLRGSKIEGHERIVLTTGGKSEKFMKELYPDIADICYVQFADFLHYATIKAVEMGFNHLLYGCFFGKLCKWAMGYKYTHAHTRAQNMKLLAELAKKSDLSERFVKFVEKANTAREIFESSEIEKEKFIDIIGRMALKTLVNFAGQDVSVKIHLFSFEGKLCATYEKTDILR